VSRGLETDTAELQGHALAPLRRALIDEKLLTELFIGEPRGGYRADVHYRDLHRGQLIHSVLALNPRSRIGEFVLSFTRMYTDASPLALACRTRARDAIASALSRLTDCDRLISWRARRFNHALPRACPATWRLGLFGETSRAQQFGKSGVAAPVPPAFLTRMEK